MGREEDFKILKLKLMQAASAVYSHIQDKFTCFQICGITYSREIPELKCLAFLRFITLLSPSSNENFLVVSQKTAMIFFHYLLHVVLAKIRYFHIDKFLEVYLRFEVL